MGLVSTLLSRHGFTIQLTLVLIEASCTDTLILVNLACVVTGQHDVIISTDGWCGSRSRADHYESVPTTKRTANVVKKES